MRKNVISMVYFVLHFCSFSVLRKSKNLYKLYNT